MKAINTLIVDGLSSSLLSLFYVYLLLSTSFRLTVIVALAGLIHLGLSRGLTNLAKARTRISFEAERHGSIDELVKKMVVPTDLKPARVCFSPEAAADIREHRYYWGFVKETSHAQGVEMHFLTPDYDYLARWLVGFCDRVTVTAPMELQDRMRAFARRLYRHYLN